MSSAGQPLRLGVVVLNWNGRAHLQACLRSLALSDHTNHFVVVVDNGSRDGSVTMVREEFPGVEVVALTENRRFAGGNNAGALHAIEAGAQLVLLLNNDATVEPSTLRHLTAVFDVDPTIGVAGPRIVYSSRPETIWYGGGEFRAVWGWVAHRALRRGCGDGADPDGPTDWVTGCALAARAVAWEELGGLDERFYIYAEDVDFCRRAVARGWRIAYTSAARVHHDVSSTVGGEHSPFKAYHRARSRRQFLRRHGESPLALLLPFAEDLFRGVRAAALGHGDVARALVAAWTDSLDGEPHYPASSLELASDPSAEEA